MSLYLATVADAISKISISGITVKDKDQLAAAWTGQTNVLYPNPNEPGWISDFSVVYNVAGGLETAAYTLNYRFLSTQIGDLSTFPAEYSSLVDKVSSILDALMAAVESIDSVTVRVSGVSVGARIDPSENQYHGADISLSIVEGH